jgi:hypothetical protein
MIKRVQEFAPWLRTETKTLPEHYRVLSSKPGGTSLWSQLVEFVGTGAVSRITINGAFFDTHLSFIEKVRNDFSPEELIVGIDPSSVQFPTGIKLPPASFVNCASLAITENNHKKAGYLHAKSLLIQREDDEMVLAVGSANPSYQAWLATDLTMNIEMMIARKGNDAKEVAKELGLTTIASMPPLTNEEWAVVKYNWENKDQAAENEATARFFIATLIDDSIRFRLSGIPLLPVIDCEVVDSVGSQTATRQAQISGNKYILSASGINSTASFIRLHVDHKHFVGLIHDVKKLQGLSRTDVQRRFNDALISLTTGTPDLEHFVECIKNIIEISDRVNVPKPRQTVVANDKGEELRVEHIEGTRLSIGLDEVMARNQLRNQRLRSFDDLGYLLDVLLYNLREENLAGLDDTMEYLDAKGRSEEEQIGADDEEEVILQSQKATRKRILTVAIGKSVLETCHSKVRSLVTRACTKLDALKRGGLGLPQFVIIAAATLSALRLLRGLDGRASWIGTGQSTVPQKEFQRYFNKIGQVVFDGDKSIIRLDDEYSQLADVDEFARLRGLIIWLAWESGICLTTNMKLLNEPVEAQQRAQYAANRLYAATTQLISGDEDVIREARQSIGQLSSGGLGWLEKMCAIDRLFRDTRLDYSGLADGSAAKTGDFGFNIERPEIGVREIIPADKNNVYLFSHSAKVQKYIFPVWIIRTIPLDLMCNRLSR